MTQITTPPNTKHSTIRNLTISPSSTAKETPSQPNCPSISHSKVTESVFNNLTSASKISHSTLNHVVVGLMPDGPASARIKHSNLGHSTLTDVASVNHSRVSNSQLATLPSVRATITNSSVSDCERVKRAEIKGSNVRSTELKWAKLDSTRAAKSKLRRAVLKDCDVENCVISRSEFTGMRLRNGVWKHGKLIGRVDGVESEVGAVSLVSFSPCSRVELIVNESSGSQAKDIPSPKKKWEEAERDAFLEGASGESERSSISEDRPPAYEP